MFFFFKSKQEVSLGWNYFMTIWYMLSFGSIDAIKAVYYSNKRSGAVAPLVIQASMSMAPTTKMSLREVSQDNLSCTLACTFQEIELPAAKTLL